MGLLPVGFAAESAVGDWQALFDGASLAGWRASENAGGFRVVDGTILCQGSRSHLFYEGPGGGASFRNFELEAEVQTQPGANSGLYFHTRYQERGWPEHGHEIQINNTATGEGGYRENKKTGSLYGIRNLYKQCVADREWFRLRLIVRGPHYAVWVNDLPVVDYVDPAWSEATPPAGTFALQCHDPGSQVQFRNLRVRRLPDDVPARTSDATAYRISPALAALHADNYPVIDLHTHLKGGLTHTEVLQRMYRTGINAGIAVNCGLGFAITNDAGIDRALAELRHPLTFSAMQAEGREWVDLFTLPAVARFDYVFTDAMTVTDEAGRRMRLWIPNEAHVEDAPRFLEMLVRQTEAILDREPVDLLVNPTFLPDPLSADADRLWTAERRQRVIRAAARHGVAIEINDRLRLPSATFLREAKAAGLKFSLGTNNGGRADLGALEYCVRMIRECDLGWQDLWVPGLQPTRAQRALATGQRTVARP
jgi:hypothetical protein